MPSDLSCPYCNSPAVVPVGAHPGQRIPCARCGESFPYRAAADDRFTASPPPMPLPALPPMPAPPERFSNTGIALVILSVMIVMALIGLLYALQTAAIRRSYDVHLPKTKAISIPIDVVFPLGLYVLILIVAWFRGWNRRDPEATTTAQPRRYAGLLVLSVAVLLIVELGIIVMHARAPRPSEEEGPPVRPVQPKELLALGYLPADTDVIIALHAGELLSEPVGRDLVNHLGSDEINARSFEGWSGLKLQEIDHAVLGLTLDGEMLGHFTLVVRARRPLDRKKVLDALRAEDARDMAGRSVHPVSLETGVANFRRLGSNLWFADDQTLVVARVFDAGPDHRVPMTPVTELKNLRPELRQLIEERIGPSAQFWIAGRMPAENEQFLFLHLALQKAENAPLAQLKRFGLWVTVHPTEMVLRGAFECTDEDAAKALQDYLAPSNRRGLKEWLAPPEAGPLERALGDSMKRTQNGPWVELQAKASADAVRQGNADHR